MTTDQFIKQHLHIDSKWELHTLNIDVVILKDMLKQFAELHVKQALEAAVNNVEIERESTFLGEDFVFVNGDSILNCYIDKIK